MDDPRAADLAAAWARCGEDAIIAALFGAGGLIVSEWRPTAQDIAMIPLRANMENT